MQAFFPGIVCILYPSPFDWSQLYLILLIKLRLPPNGSNGAICHLSDGPYTLEKMDDDEDGEVNLMEFEKHMDPNPELESHHGYPV